MADNKQHKRRSGKRKRYPSRQENNQEKQQSPQAGQNREGGQEQGQKKPAANKSQGQGQGQKRSRKPGDNKRRNDQRNRAGQGKGRSSSRRGRRSGRRRENDPVLVEYRKEIQAIKEDRKECAICGAMIEDMLTTLEHKETGEPCHFECVQKDILKEEELQQNEKLVYIGNGDFGIIQERRNRGKAYIFMRKRIHYREQSGSKRSATG